MSGPRAGCPGLRAGCPGSKSEDELEELDFGAEIDDFGGKIGEISWMESGETWVKDRSTSNHANPWIKINKTSSNLQITKKIGAIFWWGIFEFRTKSIKLG